MTTPRDTTVYRSKVVDPGTKIFVRARIKSEPQAPGQIAIDLEMPIQFTFNRADLYEAEWYGTQWEVDAIKYRMARLLLTEDNLPANGTHALYAQVDDELEQPILHAGTLKVV